MSNERYDGPEITYHPNGEVRQTTQMAPENEYTFLQLVEDQLGRVHDRLKQYYDEHPEYHTSGWEVPSLLVVAYGEIESAAFRVRSHHLSLKTDRAREDS